MKKKLIAVFCVLLAFALCVLASQASGVYLRPRRDSPFLTYEPFSGKLFQIDVPERWCPSSMGMAVRSLPKPASGRRKGRMSWWSS